METSLDLVCLGLEDRPWRKATAVRRQLTQATGQKAGLLKGDQFSVYMDHSG